MKRENTECPSGIQVILEHKDVPGESKKGKVEIINYSNVKMSIKSMAMSG